MRSHSSSANLHCFSHQGVFRSTKRSFFSIIPSTSRASFDSTLCCRRPSSYFGLKRLESSARKHGLRRKIVQVSAMDEGISSLDDWEDNDKAFEYTSSDGDDSDGEYLLNPVIDVDLPSTREKFLTTNDALTMTAHRFAMIGKGRKKRRIKYGVMNNIGLITFLTVLVFVVDCCAWRIVRLPLEPFYLMRPFCISAVLVSCAGYICVPILFSLKACSIIRKVGPVTHSTKKGTPTMGGLFFIPIGIIVAEVIVGFSSIEVSGAAAATLAFAAIGLLDDILSLIKNDNNGLSAWMRILLEVAVGTWFSFWLAFTNISSPYSMKMLVPLPAPLGLVCLGKSYLFLTSFCFVSMGNGINLTDGLDGLAGGTAALAFVAMSIAVLPICSDLAVFGASMAGACIGFLLHNRYKASVFMGDTGSLALGGALAAMAACTGMFLPLFVSSGIFVLEALSVTMQVSVFKITKRLRGTGHRIFRMAPFHHHLEMTGMKEPIIVAVAYAVSYVLALFAGYMGLISA
ncbi:phospho-N-acetylmuramoyl-pentapeptide-transferase homolog [Cornus florida]|uniref:phospho-N-acetylmuramoyl-pentapeptide- transferase homolog n=1 Tax=Cornus florida TaxID=4283 RepID=UPI00289CD007|nr:phospho-N-acetylmuramoyl-pentapeptide-transferase homolog [Cornus florida]